MSPFISIYIHMSSYHDEGHEDQIKPQHLKPEPEKMFDLLLSVQKFLSIFK